MAIEKFGTARIEMIRSMEGTYNLKLPSDYIKYLLEYNGGNVVKDEHCQLYVKSLKNNIHVDILFGIDTGYENAEINTWMSLFKGEMLDGALIIGDSIEHGFIVLMCTDNESGICYWDHAYKFPESNEESNTYFIADAFTDLLNRLS